MFGAVLSADGGPVRIGSQCVILEQAVLRGTRKHPLLVGDRVLVGPHAYLSGCTVANEAFLATGCSIFNGAQIGAGAEVRIHGTVHIGTALSDRATVPIGWVAVGDPAELFPPGRHDAIWSLQEALDFPQEVFGVDRSPEMMTQIMHRYTKGLARHRDDRIVAE